jgi:hypothetical protein
MMGYGRRERSEREMFTLHTAGLRPVRVVGQAWTLSCSMSCPGPGSWPEPPLALRVPG